MTDPVRACALECLIRIFEDKEFCDEVLDDVLPRYEDKRDRAFLDRLVMGVTERAIELDYIIDSFSKTPSRSMKPVIRHILRMGVYQLKYMDQVPAHAAVDQAVRLTKWRGLSGLSGFVNGILRAAARALPGPELPAREAGFVRYASVRYSVPEWIVEQLESIYGTEQAESIFAAWEQPAPLTVRFNLSLASEEEILSELASEGTEAAPTGIPGVYRLSGYDSVSGIGPFTKGWLQVQDEASALAGMAAAPRKGDLVLDLCAAPGGKSLQAADMLRGTGHVEARDVKASKTALIDENIARCGFKNISTRVFDATQTDPLMTGKADVVIADLPCSGLGAVRRKKDIKYRLTPEGQRELVRLQRQILEASWQYVRPGGRLVYSTCTILPSENEENADLILNKLPFEEEPFGGDMPAGYGGGARQLLLPGRTDGFFIARFTRRPL